MIIFVKINEFNDFSIQCQVVDVITTSGIFMHLNIFLRRYRILPFTTLHIETHKSLFLKVKLIVKNVLSSI